MTLTTARLGAWSDLAFFAQDLPKIQAQLDAETRDILPPEDVVFAALELCQPHKTRVVILGQDPYPTPGHAHGLAFSAQNDTKPLPKSLANIYKEMRSDLGSAPDGADLRFWAHQGVLLLNTVLTTPAKTAGGHRKIGWETLTGAVLRHLDPQPRAFILWGKDAQAHATHLTNPDHLVLTSPHPSPLSAYRGFFGSRPFSTVNQWLTKNANSPINWTSPQ